MITAVPPTPTVTFTDVRRRLTKLGFRVIRKKGRHQIWADDAGHKVTVQHHNKDARPGVLKSMAEQAGFSTINEFLGL